MIADQLVKESLTQKIDFQFYDEPPSVLLEYFQQDKICEVVEFNL